MYLPFSQYRVFSVLFGLYLVRPSSNIGSNTNAFVKKDLFIWINYLFNFSNFFRHVKNLQLLIGDRWSDPKQISEKFDN